MPTLNHATFAALALTLLAAGAAHAQNAAGNDHGPMSGQMFEKADTNHDGAITLPEMEAMQRTHTEKMFAEADTNHDGKLSPDEVRVWREGMRARMMQRWAARRAQTGGALQERNNGSVIEANKPLTPQHP